MLRHIRLCSQQWHKCSWRAQYLFGNQIQSEKVKMNLETIAQVGNIKACCASFRTTLSNYTYAPLSMTIALLHCNSYSDCNESLLM